MLIWKRRDGEASWICNLMQQQHHRILMQPGWPAGWFHACVWLRLPHPLHRHQQVRKIGIIIFIASPLVWNVCGGISPTA